MSSFYEKLRLRGKVEEDRYFAEVDRQLIEAMHEKQREEELEHQQQDLFLPEEYYQQMK